MVSVASERRQSSISMYCVFFDSPYICIFVYVLCIFLTSHTICNLKSYVLEKTQAYVTSEVLTEVNIKLRLFKQSW
jgi:hypothetical protein